MYRCTTTSHIKELQNNTNQVYHTMAVNKNHENRASLHKWLMHWYTAVRNWATFIFTHAVTILNP